MVPGIAETAKPVAGFSIERCGDPRTVEMAARQAKGYVRWATELKREPIKIGDPWVSAKCGESDTTLGSDADPAIGRVLERMIAGGATAIFGETSEAMGGQGHRSRRRAGRPASCRALPSASLR